MGCETPHRLQKLIVFALLKILSKKNSECSLMYVFAGQKYYKSIFNY